MSLFDLERLSRDGGAQAMMTAYRNACLSGSDETRRRFIDNKPDGTVFYRKLSRAEWAGATANGTKNYDFDKPFEYTNTNNYRFWMSTSLDKVRLFGNENATTSSDVIVMFVFKTDLVDRFKSSLKAHQAPGAQHDANAVAMHREGFGRLVIGGQTIQNLSDEKHVKAVLDQKLAYNLGFTSSQKAALRADLIRSETVTS